MQAEMRRRLTRPRALMLAVLALVAAGSQSASSDTWRILSVDGRSVLGDAEMVFGGAGAVSGSTGCNRFTTTAAMEGSTLVLSQPLAVTKMACPDEALTALVDTLRDWTRLLELPRIGAYGMSERDIPRVVASCRGGSMQTNPLVLSDAELAGLLRSRL